MAVELDQPSLFVEDSDPLMEQAVGAFVTVDDDLVTRYPAAYWRGNVTIHRGDVLGMYGEWEPPTAIISDGPYGVAGFPGDPPSPEGLVEWYEPHIQRWSEKATPRTTLWFWNTEIGWATVHPVLAKYGWQYRMGCTWDKGIAHVAGNCNTNSLRKLPIVSELCVQYVKPAVFEVGGRTLSMKQWLRREWKRTGLPFNKANEACGVKDAATRKYLTQCHLWYFPPREAFDGLTAYANVHGDPNGRPYFSLDGVRPIGGDEWERMRSKFHCEVGTTNVWREPAVRGQERIKRGTKSIHANQKPLRLTELLIRLSTDPGDMVWEPFGGLCTGAIASHRLGRMCRAAEILDHFYELAISRLAHYDQPGAQ
jgi:hypothetical protein